MEYRPTLDEMKRLSVYLVLVALSCVCAPVSAQTPDTTEAERYFPLEVGNVWEYEGLGLLNHSTDYRIEVEADTLIGGQRYFLLTHDALDCSPCLDRYTVRFDAETGRIVERTSEGEVAWWYADCELNAPFEDETTCGEVVGGYEETFELADGSVLEGVTYKVFDSGFELHGYVADVGFVTEAILQMEPGEARLRYARVDGVEYGTPFPVSAEDDAAPESAVALSLYPNPTRGTTTLTLALDRPQRVTLSVYDVLGRRVLADDLGALPAGEQAHRLDVGALPSGVYILRLTGEAGARAMARLVRQ